MRPFESIFGSNAVRLAVLAVATGVSVTTTSALSLPDFKTCVGANGASFGSSCALDPNPAGGPYVIGYGPGADSGTIEIRRPVSVYGWNATLERQAATSNLVFTGPLIRVDVGAGGAQLFYFTVDGGRAQNPSQSVVAFDGDVVFLDQGSMYSSLLANSPNVSFKVQAPNVNLSYSTISNSARWGIWTDSAVTTSFVAYDNTFVDSGANAVSFGGTNAYIGFNQFYGNHRACPFGSNGGQLLVTQYSDTVRVDHNTIADGPAFCDAPQNQYWADGLELYGSHLIVSDNTIVNNGGHGIQLGGVQLALIIDVYTNATIAQNNRRDSKFSGIWVGTAVSENSNIQLASLNVGGGQCSGITFQDNSPGSSVANSCISGNQIPGVSVCKGCDVALGGLTENSCPLAAPAPVSQTSVNIEAIYHLFIDLQTADVSSNYLFDEMGLSASGRSLVVATSQTFIGQVNTITRLGDRATVLLNLYTNLQNQLGGEGALIQAYLLARS